MTLAKVGFWGAWLNLAKLVSPLLQVQQRGVAATGDIITKLLEGLELADGHPVLLVDCLPNRFFVLCST